MANELRVRGGFVAGALTADIAIGGTSMSSGGLADLPVVDSTSHAAITLVELDADGRVTKKEIVYVTAHTASATTATIVKGQEGTTDQAWNGTSSPDDWSHGLTLRDVDAGRVQMVKRVSGTQPSFSSTSWVNANTALDLTLPAYAGDLIEFGVNGLWNNDAVGGNLDVVTIVSSSIVNYIGGSGTIANDGVAGWFGASGTYETISGSVFYLLQPGDISSGAVLLRLIGKSGSSTTKTLLASADDPLFVWAKNHGPQAA